MDGTKILELANRSLDESDLERVLLENYYDETKVLLTIMDVSS